MNNGILQVVCPGSTQASGLNPQSPTTYQFTSLNPGIASVSGGGSNFYVTVTGISGGEATITGNVQDGYGCNATGETSANVISPVPVKFAQQSYVCKSATGTPVFVYAWSSSTGKQSDLSACQIQEVVTYTNNGVPPSPPFPASGNVFANPTLITGNGANPTFTDTQYPITGMYVPPYTGAPSFTGTQTYQYKCNGSSDWTPFPGFDRIPIVRQVVNNNGTWQYEITKSGQSCSINISPQSRN